MKTILMPKTVESPKVEFLFGDTFPVLDHDVAGGQAWMTKPQNWTASVVPADDDNDETAQDQK